MTALDSSAVNFSGNFMLNVSTVTALGFAMLSVFKLNRRLSRPEDRVSSNLNMAYAVKPLHFDVGT